MDYKVKIGAELRTKDIDTAVDSYNKPVELRVVPNMKSLDTALKGYRPVVNVNTKLSTSGITKALNNYKAKKPIKVELDWRGVETDINTKTFETPLSVKVSLNWAGVAGQIKAWSSTEEGKAATLNVDAKLDDDAISNAVKDFNAKASKENNVAKINVSVDPIFDKAEEKIKNYTPRTMMKINAKVNKNQIDNSIEKFQTSKYIRLKAELPDSAIEKAITSYRVANPVPVTIDFSVGKTEVVDTKISHYKNSPVDIPVRLMPAKTGFSDEITNTPVKVSATVAPEDIRQDIETAVGGYTPTAKMPVNIQLVQPKDINAQVRSLTKPTELLEVGVKLDESTIESAISTYVPKAKIKVDVQVNDGNIGSVGNGRQDIQTVRIARGNSDATRAYREMSNIANRLDSRKTRLANLNLKTTKTQQDIQEIEELTRQIENLDGRYRDLHKTFSGQFDAVQLDALRIKLETIEEKLSLIKSKALDVKASIDATNATSTTATSATSATSGENGNAKKQVDEVTQAYRDLMGVLNELNAKRLQLNGLDASSPDSSNTIQRLRLQIEQLENEYNNLLRSFNAQGIQFTADQWNEIETVMAKVGRRIDVVQAKMSDKSVVQGQTQAYKELLSISKEISSLEINIAKLSNQGGSVNQINELENQLRVLQSTYQQIVTTMETPLTDEQWSSIYTQIAKTSDKVEQLKAKYADTRSELEQKINTKLLNSDYGASQFDNEIGEATSRFRQLTNQTEPLKTALDGLEAAFQRVKEASKSGNQEELILANREYEAALKSVNTQLDINERAQRESVEAQKLIDDRAGFQAKIDAWLTKNSAAAKQFGAQLRSLQAQAENCDRVTLDHLEREFKQIDKEAEAAGKRTQSFTDRLKLQVQRYGAYFSVATLVMRGVQAARSMFEQVKLIDSAMTELKKVTDETDASYNKFLSSAASKAKELGTTIDGLVSSTADFARLGYGFEDAQELAEVANIYAVVGDEIEGIDEATKSLISTLAAFKNEASGISDADFAMNIIDKFNEVANNFAISSGGIGEAMERSASSLRAANNTIDESIALVTAANTVVQHPEAVGTAFKTKNILSLCTEMCIEAHI